VKREEIVDSTRVGARVANSFSRACSDGSSEQTHRAFEAIALVVEEPEA
jgi:hypothetical protein